jgi:hypothetical protein
MMKKIFILLMIVALLSAQAQFTSSGYGDWMTISIIIAGLSVVAAAGLIVLSRIFSLKNLEQIAKTEFIYAMSTVAIVIFVSILISIGEPLLTQTILPRVYLATFNCFSQTATIPNQPSTPMGFIDLYLEPQKDCTVHALDTLYILSVPVEPGATWYSEIYMSELATGYGLKIVSERIKNMAGNLIFYLYAYYIIEYLIKFINFFAGFFFTVGVALRAFPPTRGAGAYFMAAALGFYFVFPTTYVIFSAITLPNAWQTTQALVSDPCNANNIQQHYIQLCTIPEFKGYVEACGTGDFSSLSESITFLKAFKNEIIGLLDPDPSRGIITSLLMRMINAVCVVPLVAMIITMTFVLNSTNLLGGNIPEIGRGLVKLI